jgi:hypothetical protein
VCDASTQNHGDRQRGAKRHLRRVLERIAGHLIRWHNVRNWSTIRIAPTRTVWWISYVSDSSPAMGAWFNSAARIVPPTEFPISVGARKRHK